MSKPLKIFDEVYIIGGPTISNPSDCMVYLVDCGKELALIDTGLSEDISILEENIKKLGYNPYNLSTIFLTHSHIDHVGGVLSFKEKYKCKIYMHELDSEPLEKANQKLTGAYLYGVKLKPCKVDCKLLGSNGIVKVGNKTFEWFHTPGHTLGSISILLKTKDGNILFAQDVHGPFLPEFGSNLVDWGKSMKKLLSLNFDVLAEGHFGVYKPKNRAKEYIKNYLVHYGQI